MNISYNHLSNFEFEMEKNVYVYIKFIITILGLSNKILNLIMLHIFSMNNNT